MIAAPAKWSRPTIGPNVTIADAFAALCNAALAQVGANAPGVAQDADAEYLHQLRVGVRRFLSALRLFRPLLKRKPARAIAQEFRYAMRVFGSARDWDVFAVTLKRAAASKALIATAARQRASDAAQARALAGSATFQQAQDLAREWLERDPWRGSAQPQGPIVDYACSALDKADARLNKRARDVDWRRPRERHRVRIALKRLRYAADFFADCFPAQAVKPFLARLGTLQDALGELNDLAVAQELLDKVSADGKRIRHWLARREGVLIASLSREWSAFGRMRRYWRKAPHATPRTPRPSANRA